MSKSDKRLSSQDLNLLKTIKKHGISAVELNNLIKNPKIPVRKVYNHSITGRFSIGILADSHIGSKYFDRELFAWAGEVFRKKNVQNVYHAGDVVEGHYSPTRGGHIYELTHIGFTNQLNYAAKLFDEHFKKLHVHAILGNHDITTIIQSGVGANIGEALEVKLGKNKFEYLGINNAIIKLGPCTTMMLNHPSDGSAYAHSYKIQKLVESFESSQKCSILIEAHFHKALYMFLRNIHCFEAGCIQSQTDFMRGKRLAAIKGFWVLDLEIGSSGIVSLSPTFYPCYE
jgi:predicted phosphodiesterase